MKPPGGLFNYKTSSSCHESKLKRYCQSIHWNTRDMLAHYNSVLIYFSPISTSVSWEKERPSAECANVPGEVAIFQWRRQRYDNGFLFYHTKNTFINQRHVSPINTQNISGQVKYLSNLGRLIFFSTSKRGHACGRCLQQFSHTHAQNGTNLGIVRRSPVPFFSSCWENHTSSSFSVPSKKCALLSFIMRQQTPNKYC